MIPRFDAMATAPPTPTAPSVPLHPTVPMLTFLGATGTVTGSRFLVDTPRARVLIDAGLFQGLKPLRLRNWDPFPVDPATIDAVVITHAHIDHIGYLPALVRNGFDGRAHGTRGTASLARIVLPDSGHLQEEEAAYANRKGWSKHQPALPLYTEDDAVAALDHIDAHEFDEEVAVAPGVHVTFHRAGHILGSSTVTVRLADHDDRRILFSGDLGRPDHPLLRPPAPPGRPDVVVMESTYGDRRHDDVGAIERFAEAISHTAARGGTVLIPAFAVDRTEVVLLHLRRLVQEGAIPDLPIYVDSPMALRALRAYREARSARSSELRRDIIDGPDPFDGGQVTEARSVEDSIALAEVSGPAIIVSASGMASGGRVIHHLARLVTDARNTVVLVGFQAPGTRGRLLADGVRELKMFGRYLPVRAEIVDLGAFSVHADEHELRTWLGSAERPPEVVYLVHGEPEASEALRDTIEGATEQLAVVPRHLERVRLD
jgi:metallo-beta-lactamase family protein